MWNNFLYHTVEWNKYLHNLSTMQAQVRNFWLIVMACFQAIYSLYFIEHEKKTMITCNKTENC